MRASNVHRRSETDAHFDAQRPVHRASSKFDLAIARVREILADDQKYPSNPIKAAAIYHAVITAGVYTLTEDENGKPTIKVKQRKDVKQPVKKIDPQSKSIERLGMIVIVAAFALAGIVGAFVIVYATRL